MAANDRSVAPPPFPRRLVVVLSFLLVASVVGVVLAVKELHARAAPPAAPTALSRGPDETWAAGAVRAPGFRLRDENGRPVSLAAYRGRPVIVTFIDPLCRNFCPIEAARLNTVVRELPAASRPAILAVSVNVYGNAAANLRLDNSKWQLVPQWHWGVGSAGELGAVWRDYKVQVLAATKTIAGVTVHEITHSEVAYVVDGKGFERALFLWPFRAQDVLGTLRGLG